MFSREFSHESPEALREAEGNYYLILTACLEDIRPGPLLKRGILEHETTK